MHPQSMQPEPRQNQQAGHDSKTIASRDKDGKDRGQMEEDRCRDPARDWKGAPGEDCSRNAEDSHQAEMDAWKKNTVFAQVRDHAEIVVLERVPEIPELAGEEAQPGAGIRRDVIAGLVRPVPGNL